VRGPTGTAARRSSRAHLGGGVHGGGVAERECLVVRECASELGAESERERSRAPLRRSAGHVLRQARCTPGKTGVGQATMAEDDVRRWRAARARVCSRFVDKRAVGR
jgi:hypothetical protein